MRNQSNQVGSPDVFSKRSAVNYLLLAFYKINPNKLSKDSQNRLNLTTHSSGKTKQKDEQKTKTLSAVLTCETKGAQQLSEVQNNKKTTM